jgi:transposase
MNFVISQQNKNLERAISSDAAKEEPVAILMSMVGIDYYSAKQIALEVGDVSRFKTPRSSCHGHVSAPRCTSRETRCTMVPESMATKDTTSR